MHKGRAGFTGHAITMLVFVVASLAWVGYILYQAGTLPTVGKKYDITAEVPTANQLASGARVTIAGAEVGSVKSVTRDGGHAKIKMELTNDKVFPLPIDSRLELRTRTQVGENYVAIDVGNDSHTINNGGSIGMRQADDFVSVDQILSTLQGKTRLNARTFFQSLGAGLNDRGADLNRALSGGHDFIRDGKKFVDVLDRDKAQTADLIDNFGQIMDAVGDRRAAIETFARQGTATAEAVASRDESLRQILDKLPATLGQIRQFSSSIGPVGNRAAPIINNLATAVTALQPTIAALQPGASGLVPFIQELRPAAPDLRRVARTVTTLGQAVPKAVPELGKLVCNVNPALAYLNPRLPDLGQVIYHLGSASNAYDATGHTIRLSVVEGADFESGLPPEVDAAKQTLLKSGLLLPSGEVNYNPYPKIGSIGKTNSDGSGGYPGNAEQLKASGYRYPRIRAAC